jgi:hypothetical protein
MRLCGIDPFMFEWLEDEIAAIKTPRFHLFEGPADSRLREAIDQSTLPLCSAYKQFVLKFGNAELYRKSRNGYRISVYAGPREATLDDGTHIYHLGSHDDASVYVKPANNSVGLPIFEFEDGSEERVANNFKEWLEEACSRARNKYGKQKWAAILRGPIPFTREEEAMLETRRRIEWRVLGLDDVGNHMFAITNAGNRTFPAITVGVRSKDKRLTGAIRLTIGHIGPGQSAVLHADCYKDLVPPNEIEAFALPEPQPEDREYYHEFAKPTVGNQ